MLKLLVALFIAFFLFSAVSAKCTKYTKCYPAKKTCKWVKTTKQVKLRRRAVRVVRKYKYVKVPHKRKVCYMKRVQEKYTYLSYSRKLVSYKQQYLKVVPYKAWVVYKKRVRRKKPKKYKKYYNVRVKRSKLVSRKKTVYYYKLVTVPKRCPKPYKQYYWVWVRVQYNSRCRKRVSYLKTVRYKSRCPYKVKVKYYTKEMVKVGNCYKRRVRYRFVTRYKACWKSKKVVAWKYVMKPCKKWKRVKRRRVRTVLKWGLYCKQKVKRRFSKVVTYKVRVYYWVTVRRWKWATTYVWYWTHVLRRRLVTRTKKVLAVKVLKRWVRVVKRVTKLRWTSKPAFRVVTYYVSVLRSYTVRKPYWVYYRKTLTGRKRVCLVTKKTCVTRTKCY